MDDDGGRLDALHDALTRHRPALLYTIPSFQNPWGRTMSAARRAQLVEVSRAHDLTIVADEVYQLLDFGVAPPPPLAAYAESARVLSLGSFSQICALGLRLGWMQGPSGLLDHLLQSGVVHSGGGLNPLFSGVVHSVLDLGLADTGLDALRGVYAERSAVCCRTLRNKLPTATFVELRGGYFVWVLLPPAMSAVQLRPIAAAEGVGYRAGSLFSSHNGFANAMRLSFAHYDEASMVQGVHRDLFHEMERLLGVRGRAASDHAKRGLQEVFPLQPTCAHCGGRYIGGRLAAKQDKKRSYVHAKPRARTDQEDRRRDLGSA